MHKNGVSEAYCNLRSSETLLESQVQSASLFRIAVRRLSRDTKLRSKSGCQNIRQKRRPSFWLLVLITCNAQIVIIKKCSAITKGGNRIALGNYWWWGNARGRWKRCGGDPWSCFCKTFSRYNGCSTCFIGDQRWTATPVHRVAFALWMNKLAELFQVIEKGR